MICVVGVSDSILDFQSKGESLNLLRRSKINNKHMKYLSRVLNAIYLCVRFPFLYPRNRFSDKHTVYIRWISNLTYKYYSKSYYDISL